MNIICSKESLQDAVHLLTCVVPQKAQSRPILNNIEFVVSGNTLTLQATDLEMALHCEISLIKCYEEGRILLPAEQLNNILREAVDSEIKLESLDKAALLSGKKTKYKLPTLASEPFPEIPDLEGETINLNCRSLTRIFNEVSFAMNKERNRFSLNSLLLCLNKSKMEAVATDQVRLAYSCAELDQPLAGEEKYFFPAKAVSIIQMILAGCNDETIAMVKGRNQVTLKFSRGFFITRLVDAQFPNYHNAIDGYKDKPGIVLKTEEMGKAIRQMMLLTCDNARNIAMHMTNGKLNLQASTPLGEGAVDLDIDYTGEDVSVGINPQFVQDFLKEVHSQNLETVYMKMAGPRAPVILQAHDQYIYFMSPTAV